MTDRPMERKSESIWSRLHSRKVVQWGLVYVAAAWGFLQGLEYASDAFQWPPQIRQVALLALLIGLPVVLVLAWYHGDRGQQRVTTPEVVILVLLLLLGGGAFWYYQRVTELGKAASPAASEVPPEPSPALKDARPSIAVLPFENRSRLDDDAFFVEGIHDDILTQLSKVSGLKVISRTSVEQFRGTKLPLKAIAEQLGVETILEGGVQRGGDRVRINVQLIDAATDAHLWAETFDKELTSANIFAIQSELATAIASALKTTLSPAEKVRVAAVPTQSLEAWEEYQIGRQRMARRTSAALAEAEQFFRQAISLDPSFARAHAALADALLLQVDYSGRPFEAIQGDAESSIATAMRLEPTSAEAWAARGNIELARYQLDLAEQSLRRAIELNPNFVQAQHWLSVTLQRRGRLAEALLAAETAVSLDPLSQVAAVNLANRLSDAGRFDEAEGRLRRAIQIDPSAPGPYSLLSTLQSTALNRQADAASMLEKAISLDQDSPLYLSNLATLYLDLGDPSRARRLIASAQHRWPDSGVVAIYAAIIASSQDGREAAEKLVATMVARVPRDVVPQSIMRNADLARGDHKSARARYAAAYPDLLASTPPKVDVENYWAAIDLALVLRGTGEAQRASILLRESERAIKALPRLGWGGYWIADVQIHALRGEKAHALAMLRVAEQAGWRSWWLYYRDVEPNLASIRNEPEFKAIFADIERDMARQRAALAARPTDAVVELEAAGT